MANEIRSFAVTVPAGTTKDVPQLTDLSMPPRTVLEVDVLIPPGPLGQVGFALSLAGQPIIPYNAGEWIVADDDTIRWPLDGYPDSGAWQLTAYNTGVYDHTLQIRFLLALIGAPAPVAQVPAQIPVLTGPVPPGPPGPEDLSDAELAALLAQADQTGVAP